VIIKTLNSITNTTEEEEQQEDLRRELMSWRWEWEVMGVKGGASRKLSNPTTTTTTYRST
jgi:hypothetical protein